MQIGELDSYSSTLPNLQKVELNEGCFVDNLVIGKGMFREVEEWKMKGNKTRRIEIGDGTLNRIEELEIGMKVN